MKIKESIKRVIVGLLTFSVCVCLMLSSAISVSAEESDPSEKNDDLKIESDIEDGDEIHIEGPEGVSPTSTPYELRISFDIPDEPPESGGGTKDEPPASGNGTKEDAFVSGKGTKGDPYIIDSAKGFAAFRDCVDNKEVFKDQYIKLVKDIDLSDFCGKGKGDWNPIGRADDNSMIFNGSFDGGGHTISGLYIGNGGDYSALFAKMNGSGIIKNLNVKGSVNGKYNAAGIVSFSLGTIENCSFVGTVSSTSKRVGGIGGECGNIINCSVKGDISAAQQAGGIAGFVKAEKKIEGCKFSGNVSDVDVGYARDRKEFGGIAGFANGDIKNCEANGDIRGYMDVGGILGTASIHTTVSNCVFAKGGTVYAGFELAGGIVGYHCGVSIFNCNNYGSVEAASYDAGGITGDARGSVSICTNYGNVTGKRDVGGIAGESGKCHDNKGVIHSCSNFGTVSGTTFVGGIIGAAEYPIISCMNWGSVPGSGDYVGYISGYRGEGAYESGAGSVFGEGSWVMIIIYSSVTLIVIAAATFFIRRRRSKVRRD